MGVQERGKAGERVGSHVQDGGDGLGERGQKPEQGQVRETPWFPWPRGSCGHGAGSSRPAEEELPRPAGGAWSAFPASLPSIL